MIIKADDKQLEWRTYLELSKDPVGIQEVLDRVDIHSNNQERFQLPTRLVAKTFLFRWIYRGSAYAYANDFEFMPTSSKQSFWQRVIDTANEKYNVLYEYQNNLIYRAQNRETITIPSGRSWVFEPKIGRAGEAYFSEPDIANWPNQGFAADIMLVRRRIIYKKLRKLGLIGTKLFLFNTVHDDIELDVDNDPELLYNVCSFIIRTSEWIPKEFKKLFGYDLSVPFETEVSFGKNLLETIEFKPELGKEQFNEFCN